MVQHSDSLLDSIEKKIDITTQVKQEFNLKYENSEEVSAGLGGQKAYSSACHLPTKANSVINKPDIAGGANTNNSDFRPPDAVGLTQAVRRNSLDGPARV